MRGNSPSPPKAPNEHLRLPCSLVADRRLITGSVVIKSFSAILFATIVLGLARTVLSFNAARSSIDLILELTVLAAALATPVVLTRRKLHPLPLRLELNSGELKVFFRYRFYPVPLTDIVDIRRPRLLEQLFCLNQESPLVLVTKQGKRFLIQPTAFEDPVHAKWALASFLRPRLRRFAENPPDTAILLPSSFRLFASAFLGVFAGLVVTVGLQISSSATAFAIFSAIFLCIAVLCAKGTTVLKFGPHGISVKNPLPSTFVHYNQIKTIHFRQVNGKETITIYDAFGYSPLVLTSSIPHYARIRDFLILHCTEANIMGQPDTHALELYSFDCPVEEVHDETNPEPNLPLSQDFTTHPEVDISNQQAGETS